MDVAIAKSFADLGRCYAFPGDFFLATVFPGTLLTATFFAGFGFEAFTGSLGFGATFIAATAARLPHIVANLSGGNAKAKASALQLFKVLGAICKASASGAGSQSAPAFRKRQTESA